VRGRGWGGRREWIASRVSPREDSQNRQEWRASGVQRKKRKNMGGEVKKFLTFPQRMSIQRPRFASTGVKKGGEPPKKKRKCERGANRRVRLSQERVKSGEKEGIK